jgi:carboxyl-terminal processing protease
LEFANKYLDQHHAEVKSMYGKDYARFANEFEVTKEMLDNVLVIAKAKGVEFKQDLYEKDIRYIKAYAKAYIARSLWGNEGSARVMLAEDTQFKKAVTLFPEAEKIARNLSSLK